MKTTIWGASALLCLALSAACGDDDSADKGAASDEARAEQTPPMGAAAVEAWLKKGSYRDWQCESEPHAFRAPSPHGFNRICSNDLISDNTKSSADWPKGAAAVKELYAAADDQEPVGYAVYLKTAADSAGGANWYWYERVPSIGVVADGMGDDGPAKSICVGCHAAAGSDAAHTPSRYGRDQVYTPVM
jgi:Cytochrome P460